MLVAICIYCSLFKVNHVCCVLPSLPTAYNEMETQRTKVNISLSPLLPLHLFFPPPHSHKAWDHHKCQVDRWELCITLLLGFVGFGAAHFTAPLKCGWAKETVKLVPLIGGRCHKMQT